MPQLQQSQCIPLQSGLVYGPIQSRRLGASLGINPLPVSYKLCTSNCVYCQYDWTTNENPQHERVPSADEILAAAEIAFKRMAQDNTRIDWITLAGNGEPTLHPAFELLVQGLRRLRDHYLPVARLGILSDSTLVHRPPVRRALLQLDERYMKLDVGSAEAFARVNKPMGQVDWDRMIEGLRTLPDVTLQSLFMQGSVDNTQPREVEQWLATVAYIQPKAVQIYTIDRPPADPGLRKVSAARLREIGELLYRRTHILAEVF